MTDAQHTAYKASQDTMNLKQRRVACIVRDNPGATLDDIRREYDKTYDDTLPEKTASGRVSELAKMGIIYVNGKKKVGPRRSLSRYYYEPDPACRFTIKAQAENEAFLRWLKKAPEYADRIPNYVLSWIRDRKILLENTMEVVAENKEG